MKIKSKVFLVLIIQILWLMTAYAIPNINEDTFGINAEINNAINGNKSNEILLSTSMIELSKSKEAVEQEQYNEDLQRDSEFLAEKYAWWGQVARGFTVAVQKYTQSLEFVQEYPQDMIKRWNLPPQFDARVDPNDQGKLVFQFTEPIYMGF